jgi:hypothetical protein
MESTARRTLLLLRQHPLLLSAPWLAACAVGFFATTAVQQVMNRQYPFMNTSLTNSMRNNLIHLGVVDFVLLVVGAFKVVALALMILLVKQLATQGRDTLSAALERLRKIPSIAGALLKFYAIALALIFATGLVAALPVILYIPLSVTMHLSPHLPIWVLMALNDLGSLLFVLCVMPFFLNLVLRLQRPSFSGEERPSGLLLRAMGYGALAFGIQVALGLLMRPLQRPIIGAPTISAMIGPRLIGLLTYLVNALPTIVCVVTIALMVSGTEERVTDGEPA